MRVTGIIAEYNPFHKGHEYQLKHAKEATGADYIIVVMSGNFTQRGEPAIIDKYARAKIAVMNGADLVIELPLCYATASAEYFARGAISLLNQLGVVTHLAFGSECGDIELLRKISNLLEPPSKELSATISTYMKKGKTFPQARIHAIEDVHGTNSEFAQILSSPNNILGIEYLKALNYFDSSIIPVTTLREGAAYHEQTLAHEYASASALRQAIHEGTLPDKLSHYLPECCCKLLTAEADRTYPICLNDFSDMFLYRLVLEHRFGYHRYFDITPDLSDRIVKKMGDFVNVQTFIDELKTKEMTYTHVSRALLHLLLNIRKKDILTYEKDNRYTFYGKVLAVKKGSLNLLSSISTDGKIPLITKASDFNKLSEEPALRQLTADEDADYLYQAVVAKKFHTPIVNEYKRRIQII